MSGREGANAQPPLGQRRFKASVSRAKRLMMSTRTKTIEQIIAEQEAKHAALEQRLGRLMTQRADIEETLGELYEIRAKAGAR